MAMNPMSTLTFNGENAFEILDQKARNDIEELKKIHPATDEILTLAEYLALSEEEKNSDKTFYIKDANIEDIADLYL